MKKSKSQPIAKILPGETHIILGVRITNLDSAPIYLGYEPPRRWWLDLEELCPLITWSEKEKRKKAKSRERV